MKKILALLLCTVVISTATACSGKDSAKDIDSTDKITSLGDTEEVKEEVNYENLSPSQLLTAFTTADNGVYTQKRSYVYLSSPDTVYNSVSMINHDGSFAEYGEFENGEFIVSSYYDFESCTKYRNENSNNYYGWHDYDISETPDWGSWIKNELLSDLGDMFDDGNYDLSDDGTYVWNHPEDISSFWYKASEIKSIEMTSVGSKYTFVLSAEKSSRAYDMEISFEFTDTDVTVPDSVIAEANG